MSTEPKAANPADLATRLAEKTRAKEARDEQRIQEAKARQLEALELEERFESELGQIKKFFDIVPTIEGPVVLKLGEAVLFKTWKSKFKDNVEPSLEEMHNFVYPCVVHPSKDEFLVRTGRFPALLVACAGALTALYTGGELDTKGK
jgi:hypothetical protein